MLIGFFPQHRDTQWFIPDVVLNNLLKKQALPVAVLADSCLFPLTFVALCFLQLHVDVDGMTIKPDHGHDVRLPQ